MKRARLIVLLIAVAAAAGAAMLARNMVTGTKEVVVKKTKFDTVQVLVATKKIKLGDAVNAAQLGWQEWPKSAAAIGYVTKSKNPKAKEHYSGSIARAPFLEGEPIKDQKLIKASDGGVLAAILPSGMRAISTPIREETAAGGFILPNDRVDVIVTRRVKSSRGDDHVGDTVLRNVRVLAIGQTIESNEDKKVVKGKTATLELSPRQAELLALAQSMGDISLSLRSLADAGPRGVKGPENSKNPFSRETGSSVKLMKYGVPSRAFGVN